jgi:hypothetical protein
MPTRKFPDTPEGNFAKAKYHARVFASKKKWDVNVRAQFQAFLTWMHLEGIELPRFLTEAVPEQAKSFTEEVKQVSSENAKVVSDRLKEASKTK